MSIGIEFKFYNEHGLDGNPAYEYAISDPNIFRLTESELDNIKEGDKVFYIEINRIVPRPYGNFCYYSDFRYPMSNRSDGYTVTRVDKTNNIVVIETNIDGVKTPIRVDGIDIFFYRSINLSKLEMEERELKSMGYK